MRTVPIHPKGLADMRIARAGQKYQPSNGTEGEIFMSNWCAECQRDKSMREGIDINECDDEDRCDIIANTMAYDVDDPEYPQEWQFGKDGQPCCTAFAEAGQPIAEPRCTKTRDMFSAPEGDAHIGDANKMVKTPHVCAFSRSVLDGDTETCSCGAWR